MLFNRSPVVISIEYQTTSLENVSNHTIMLFNHRPDSVSIADVGEFLSKSVARSLYVSPRKAIRVSTILKPGQALYVADWYSFANTEESFKIAAIQIVKGEVVLNYQELHAMLELKSTASYQVMGIDIN